MPTDLGFDAHALAFVHHASISTCAALMMVRALPPQTQTNHSLFPRLSCLSAPTAPTSHRAMLQISVLTGVCASVAAPPESCSECLPPPPPPHPVSGAQCALRAPSRRPCPARLIPPRAPLARRPRAPLADLWYVYGVAIFAVTVSPPSPPQPYTPTPPPPTHS